MAFFPKKVRTRFAPSPTGFLHIGTARTALFNFLFAKKHKGTFILRIEDTDRERSEERFEQDILEQLSWLGIHWDEGPYRQTEHRDIHTKYLKLLLSEKKAYYCFCLPEELEAKRQEQISRGVAPHYNGKCANLSSEQVHELLAKERKSVIRFHIPEKKVSFNDIIRGKVEFDAALFGDFVIAKDLSTPLYNFSVVVDDFIMKITHIIRGQDLLPTTPKQILLQEALGFWQPAYAHLPLILGPDQSKLSKRHEAVAVAQYKENGYLPEALVNFLAFLGWNPGGTKEVYTTKELLRDFSIEKIQKGNAIFNIQKLDFLNGFYIRQKPIAKVTELCIPYLVTANLIIPSFESQERMPNFTGYFGREIVQTYVVADTKEKVSVEEIQRIIALYHQRLKKLSEISELVDFYFKTTLSYSKDMLTWKESTYQETRQAIDTLEEILSHIKERDWTEKTLVKIIMPEAETFADHLKHPRDRGYLLWPLRVSLTGKKSSAGPFEIAAVLGKQKTLKRVGEAKKLLNV